MRQFRSAAITSRAGSHWPLGVTDQGHREGGVVEVAKFAGDRARRGDGHLAALFVVAMEICLGVIRAWQGGLEGTDHGLCVTGNRRSARVLLDGQRGLGDSRDRRQMRGHQGHRDSRGETQREPTRPRREGPTEADRVLDHALRRPRQSQGRHHPGGAVENADLAPRNTLPTGRSGASAIDKGHRSGPPPRCRRANRAPHLPPPAPAASTRTVPRTGSIAAVPGKGWRRCTRDRSK